MASSLVLFIHYSKIHGGRLVGKVVTVIVLTLTGSLLVAKESRINIQYHTLWRLLSGTTCISSYRDIPLRSALVVWYSAIGL